jgi:methylglyoxal reductase
MQPRSLGRSGITAHPVGVGCWAIGGLDWNLGLPMGWGGADEEEAKRGISLACELGANLFDTADVYGHGRSERLLGAALADRPRSATILSTKVGYFAGTAVSAYSPLHMRHQLEMSLHNLGTDYIDIYFFHNLYFGPSDEYLGGAIEQMRRFKEQGLIRAIGMRGPHTYALDRFSERPPAADKRQRFLALAQAIDPDIIGMRYNILTPPANPQFDPFEWAVEHGVGILIYKPLAQGLLLNKYDPTNPPSFADGDHRSRKRWFSTEGLQTLHTKIMEMSPRFDTGVQGLVQVALQYCLHRCATAVAVVGFRTAEQIAMNLARPGPPLTDDDVTFIQALFADVHGGLGSYL